MTSSIGSHFVGFNWEKMLTTMKRRSQSSDEQMANDMLKLSIILVGRGTNIKKIKEKSVGSDEVRRFFDMWQRKYGLTNYSPIHPLRDDAVTMVRVAVMAMFPLVKTNVKMYKETNKKTDCAITSRVAHIDVPAIFYMTTLACLIPEPIEGSPTDEITEMVYKCYIALMKIWDLVVRPGTNKIESASNVESSQALAYKSTIYSQSRRKELMVIGELWNTEEDRWNSNVVTQMSMAKNELDRVWESLH